MKQNHPIQILYTKRRLLYKLFIYCTGYQAAIKKFFSKSNYMQPSINILDAGCGTGLLTKTMYNLAQNKKIQNISFYGFDFTRAMLNDFDQWITKNKITTITLTQADILKPEQFLPQWPLFDMIVVSGMLEHIAREHITDAIKN